MSSSPQSKSVAFDDLLKAIQSQKTSAEKLDVIAGHDVCLGMHEVSPCKPFYFTILRDPIKRYVSHYHHMVDVASGRKGNQKHYPNATLAIENGKPISLHEFAEREMMSNVMANYLASAAHPDRNSKRWEVTNPDELIELAQGCLRSMDWIGFVEEFPNDLEKICQRIGVLPSAAMNQSVTDASFELTGETLEMIEWNNSIDSRIYQFAQELRQNAGSEFCKKH